METEQSLRQWIDTASFEDLLRRWRSAPAGSDPIFQGDVGDYYSKVMAEKRQAIGPSAAVAASKRIGLS